MTVVINNPGAYDISIYKDRDFKLRINTDIVDTCSFNAQVRKAPASTVLATFDIYTNTDDNYLELSLGSAITDGLIGALSITPSSINTKETLAWDLKLTNSIGDTYNLIQGKCYVYHTVSKGD